MGEGLLLKVLGDYGPFSRMGKSVGYQLTVHGENFLIDCGAPLFQQIGGHGLKQVKGLIVTHCHDDHKRWFTDLALFNMYAPDFRSRVLFLASEDVNRELIRASGPALDRSLSPDSASVIDIPYEKYIDYFRLGPRAKYRIAEEADGPGSFRLCVQDSQGSRVGPDRAKIVINPETRRSRLLFRDPESGEWVEPESYYPYSSPVFYEDESVYQGDGYSISAINAPVWHGISNVGIRVRTSDVTLVFSSDTVHDRALWKRLAEERLRPRRSMPDAEFEKAMIVSGDINDYIERAWSRQRYEEALSSFDNAFVVHDVSSRHSVVHTDYPFLASSGLRRDRTILTHSPDSITSEWMLSNSGKTYRIDAQGIAEVVGDTLRAMDADLYYKHQGHFFCGYRKEDGRYAVHEEDGMLSIASGNPGDAGQFCYRVDLYEDIGGGHYPVLDESSAKYRERPDGSVERVEYTAEGSSGRIVTDCRRSLSSLSRD